MALERDTNHSLEYTLPGTTLACSSPKVGALNVQRGLVPVGMVQHVGCIDPQLERLVLRHTERLAQVGIECLAPGQLKLAVPHVPLSAGFGILQYTDGELSRRSAGRVQHRIRARCVRGNNSRQTR